MKVYCKCPNCNHENRFKTDVSTRVEFAMKNGKTKKFNCVNCNRYVSLNVNKLYAKESKLLIILSGIIFLIGSLIGLYFVIQMISEKKMIIGIFTGASVLLIPILVFGALNREEWNRIKTFNQTYVNE